MKHIFFSIATLILFSLPMFGSEIESVAYARLVSSISSPGAPVASGKYIIFTAQGDARHTGIAFRHEDYTTIHSLERIVKRDELGIPQKDGSGKPLDTVLFYIAKVPPGMDEVQYRLVINGLWTTDPLNPHTVYDPDTRLYVSTVAATRYETFKTDYIANGRVRFTCPSKPGTTVRLAGSFNSWDPFMYEMRESSPGLFELELPLPSGTWYYAYFDGMSQLPDTTNPERVYTRDGRVASVVHVD
ncbi:MAG TPA: isoamylase [Treponema sp.]|nr:isoamylase [Treponema sp.]